MQITSTCVTNNKPLVVRVLLVLALIFAAMVISQPVHAETTYMNSGREGRAQLTMGQVRELYHNIGGYSSIYSVEPVVSGDYRIAILSDAAYRSAENRINYYRQVAGLDPIQLTAGLNESAAYGALVNAANNTGLSHHPSQPAGMSQEMYNLGYSACSQSNLSLCGGYGSTSDVLETAIDIQMEDEDYGNIDRVGHRRWLLNPTALTFGIGTANNDGSYYTAIRVFGNGMSSANVTDYDFISWPASGNNINDTFYRYNPWSITLNPNRYKTPDSSVKVSLKEVSTGKTWNFSNETDTTAIGRNYDYFNVDRGGYGVSNCIIFRPAFAEITEYYGDYIVNVEGIYDRSGNPTSISYKVTFEPSEYKSVKDLTISELYNYTYDGTPKKASVYIHDGNTSLTEGKDYTLEYSNNVNAGTASVRITGTGRRYTGSVTKTYTIRKASQDLELNTSSFLALKEFDRYQVQVSGQKTKITYKSNHPEIASISSNGLIQAVSSGAVAITVTAAASANYEEKTKTINVWVSEIYLPFNDVSSSAWYYTPLKWAVKNKITNGTTSTTFSPNQVCSRAQIVTFLWNAAGQPSVKGVTNPFTDVKSTDWYYDAVLWAVSKKITNGTSATTFSPNKDCTRGQVVTFLWNWAGQPNVSASVAFNDVSKTSYYYPAVRWAVSAKVTNGKNATTFAPEEKCTRAQVVTFLYNYLGK